MAHTPLLERLLLCDRVALHVVKEGLAKIFIIHGISTVQVLAHDVGTDLCQMHYKIYAIQSCISMRRPNAFIPQIIGEGTITNISKLHHLLSKTDITTPMLNSTLH